MTKAPISLHDLRRKIYAKAKSESSWRFWGLYVHVCKMETLREAYKLAKQNNGAPGIDGVTFVSIEKGGAERFLEQIQDELVTHRYRPMRNRKHGIPKDGGKVRVLQIPAIRDRVVQGALKLILEPIFEADFQSGSYGYRPQRTAHQALERVTKAICEGKTRVIDVDLSCFFDNVRHHLLFEKVARRVNDDDVMHLLRLIVKTAGKKGVPQGGVMTPPTQRAISSSRRSWATSVESGPIGNRDIKGSIVMSSVVVVLCHGRRTPGESRSVCAARQRCSGVPSLRVRHRGGVAAACPPVPDIRAASPPVRGAGPRERAGGGPEREDSVHREAPGGSGPAGSATGQTARTDHQCLRCLGAERVLGAPGSQHARWAIGASSSTMSSTGWAMRILSRRTGYSSQSAGG